MSKTYQTAILIKGDASGGVKAVKATKSQIDSLNKTVNKSDKSFKSYRKTVDRTGKSLTDFSGKAKAALGILSGAALAREAIQLADGYKQMEARLKLATDSQYQFNLAQEEVIRISRATHTALDTNATLYSRMAIATKELDIEQRTLFEASEALRHSFRAYGTSSEEAASATLQLTQAMAKGKLDGDEFRSVMENAPLVMEALKDSLGITKKELFEFSRSGKLSVEDLVNSLADNLDKFKSQSAEVPTTVKEAVIGMTNEIQIIIGEFDKATGASDKLVKAIGFLGENFTTLISIVAGGAALRLTAPLLATIGTTALATAKNIQLFGVGLVALNAKAATATVTMNGLKGAMALLGGPAGVAVLAGVAIYKLSDSMTDVSVAGQSAKKAIDDVQQALKNGITGGADEYERLRQKLAGINDQLEQMRHVNALDALDTGMGRIALTSNRVEKALLAQKKELEKQLYISEKVATAKTLLTKVLDKYAKTIKEKEVKAQQEAIEAEKRRLELAAQKAERIELETELIRDYGTEAEKIALIEAERNAELKHYTSLTGESARYIELINKKYDEQIKKLKGIETGLKGVNDETDALMRDLGMIDETAASFAILEARIEEMAVSMGESHPIVLQMVEALNMQKLAADGAAQSTEKYKRIIDGLTETGSLTSDASFLHLIDQGMELQDIFGSINQSMREGGQGMANGLNVALQGAQFLADVWESTAGQDDAGRILDSFSQIGSTGALGPAVQAISQIASTINSLTGGRLFGTSYEAESARSNISIGQGGVSGELTTREVRQRSLFRGRQWRETVESLGSDVLASLEAFYDELESVLYQSQRLVGGSGAELIGGSFQQEFDKDGNLVREFSEIAGRIFEETQAEFEQRLTAENILSGLGTVYTEANRIAELWRDDAATLLDGSQMLLQAAAGIDSGRYLFDNLEATTYIITEMQQAGETLVETYERVYGSTILLEDAFTIMGASFEGGRDEFIELAAGVTEAAGGLEAAQGLWQNFFDNFYDPQELLNRSLAEQSDLLGQRASNLGLDPSVTPAGYREAFEAALADGLSEEDIVAWLELGQSITNVTDLIKQHNEAIYEQIENLQAYIDFNRGIQDQIDDFSLTEFQASMRDIERQEAANVARLHELAEAAGMAETAEEDLARVHQLTAMQTQQLIASLQEQAQNIVSELYGSGENGSIDDQIAQLESQLNSGISSVGNASDNLFESWQRAIERIREYSNSLLIDNRYSPLEAPERLQEALNQYWETYALAQAGDLDAAGNLTGLADSVLSLNQLVNASGADANEIFYAIRDSLDSLNIPAGLSPSTGGPSTVNIGVSAELEALYAQQRAQEAAEMTQHRLELAQQLALHVNDLALALNQPVLNVLTDMGVDLNEFLADLGINLENATGETVASLANLAQTFGIEITELANGVDFALGDLADAQSLLNDGLEHVINGLPQGIESRLNSELRAIETASDPTVREQLLSNMESYINTLAPDIRNELAPFFGGVDPTSPEVITSEATASINELLSQVITEDGMTIAGLGGLDLGVDLDIEGQFGNVTNSFQTSVNTFFSAVQEFGSATGTGTVGSGGGDPGGGGIYPDPEPPVGPESLNKEIIVEFKAMKAELIETKNEIKAMKSMQRRKFDESIDQQSSIVKNTKADNTQRRTSVPPRTLSRSA